MIFFFVNWWEDSTQFYVALRHKKAKLYLRDVSKAKEQL